MRLICYLAICASAVHAVRGNPPTYLSFQVYNPFNNSIFTTASEILSAEGNTVLIDAQFESKNAEVLVNRIKATKGNLDWIYISHSDPDYYFGLDVIQDSFPDAKIVATKATVEAINATYELKQSVWDPQMGPDAPKRIVIPEAIDIDSHGYLFDIARGHPVYVLGPQANRTFVYVPSISTVMGGVTITANEHVWMADTQTPESIKLWDETLCQASQLRPCRVVPGHYVLNADGSNPFTPAETIDFTRKYVSDFTAQAAAASNSTQLIDAMKKLYPNFTNLGDLETSAKVAKGEMKWP